MHCCYRTRCNLTSFVLFFVGYPNHLSQKLYSDSSVYTALCPIGNSAVGRCTIVMFDENLDEPILVTEIVSKLVYFLGRQDILHHNV